MTSGSVQGPDQGPQLPAAPNVRTDIAARLARIEGHVHAIRGMLDEDKPSGEIILQLAAVRGAMIQVIAKVLEGHLEAHVRLGASGPAGEESMGQLRESLKILMRQF
jgi:DNA-binding FrmR family transcriptional regulator